MVRSWKLQYFDKYLHNKNILEYAQILVTGGKFMIFDIEGHSTLLVIIIAAIQFYTDKRVGGI